MSSLPAAVLFDLDGTLVDTEPLWQTAQRQLAVERGERWDPAVIEHVIGKGLVEGAMILASYTGIQMDPEDMVDYLVGHVRQAMHSGGLLWFPGIKDLLALLATEHVPAALVTSSYRVLANEIIDAVDEGTFRAVVPGDEIDERKPHPAPYLRAAKMLGVPIEKCLVIEDSPVGVQSGLASGAAVVAIPKMVAIPPTPGLTRLRSAAELNVALLERLAAGETVDTVGA